MNVSPIQNNQQAFQGKLLIKNFKTNTVEKFVTDAKADKEIVESFEKTINKRMFVIPNGEENLTKLKNYIANLFEITNIKPKSKLEYPSAKDIDVKYSSFRNQSEIDVPGYFSIRHNSD